MNRLLISVALGAGFLLSVSAYADAPAGSTAQCKDGTYYSGTEHKGACKGHQGVKEWLDKTAATPAAKTKPATTTPAAKPAPKTAAAPTADTTAAATPSKKPATKKKTPAATAAATPPAGSTAQCKDGTYYSGTEHKGACRGHKGVKKWLDTTAAEPAVTPTVKPAPKPATAPAATAPAATAPAAPAATKAAPPAAAPAATAPATSTAATRTPPTPASQIAQKAGGGPGLVWVNSSSKVYHCQGDEWYGKTKEGSYMTEAAATAGGNRADHGKTCK